MGGTEIRPAGAALAKKAFVDLPFRLHGHDPSWVPPLRYAVYDRLSKRHPAAQHQHWAMWTAHRAGTVVGRIAACTDSQFDELHGEKWGWVGFFDSVDDKEVAGSLFEVATDWCRRQGAQKAVGPGNFTTNDEIGLLVDGFDRPATMLTLENPPYYEALWTSWGWAPAMDLYGWLFERDRTALSDRQRKLLQRLKQRSEVRARQLDMADYDADVGRFFALYNRTWQHNWGFAPMPEAEVRHLAKALKPVINPRWAFALEKDGEPIGVCLAVPDVNRVLLRARSGRLLPVTWARLLTATRKGKHVRVIALGVVPEAQSMGLGPLLYGEIVSRLYDDGVETAEASWTLATNHRINSQLEDLGATRYKMWRVYEVPL
ncbi:MAG TPA: GNAT family N-acetyltransferase [Acidimicrobiales bacterium]|nr:GNAT family N-acetyltransferase [Acidimicrobiales bacterium]